MFRSLPREILCNYRKFGQVFDKRKNFMLDFSFITDHSLLKDYNLKVYEKNDMETDTTF